MSDDEEETNSDSQEEKEDKDDSHRWILGVPQTDDSSTDSA